MAADWGKPKATMNDWMRWGYQNESFSIWGNMADCAPGHEGKPLVTSPVCEVRGDLVRTYNSVYRLGTPSAAWLMWLERNGKQYDAGKPLGDFGAVPIWLEGVNSGGD